MAAEGDGEGEGVCVWGGGDGGREEVNSSFREQGGGVTLLKMGTSIREVDTTGCLPSKQSEPASHYSETPPHLLNPPFLHTNLPIPLNIPALLNIQHGFPLLLRNNLNRISHNAALNTNSFFLKLLHLLADTRFNR